MGKQEPNKALKCYLDTFGKPAGHKVLKDLMNTFDGGISEERLVIDFIKDRMKAACGSDRKRYADIMFEIERLVIEYNIEP